MSKKIKLYQYAFIASFINLILYQFAFFKFVFENIQTNNFNGILLIVSLFIASFLANALVFYLILFLFRSFGKWILALFFIINAISIYFVNTYGIIIDETMIGNIFNTRVEESGSFLSLKMILFVLFLGILPSIFLLKMKFQTPSVKKFSIHFLLSLLFLLAIAYANATNWLWIDKNSKKLGGLVMPWSYVVNTNLYFIHKNKRNKKEIKLPDATLKNNKKEVVVLVIGESARRSNFSLYGYDKDTNPLLSKVENLKAYKANSCATYTTGGVKCILDHKETNKLYEILPNYLYRNGVDVIWKTTNWGEPPVHIKTYLEKKDLRKNCKGEKCKYDEILLNDLENEITNSAKNKILIVLHTSTSHGPTYYKKYPKEFEKFSPVCKNVELANCSREELINAYDNTIVYTDYILNTLINKLKSLKDYKSSMIFISDHGESLGEKNLYMHGIPISFAPKEQYEIPFIVWSSNNSAKDEKNKVLSQHYVFHSILDFLDVASPIYNPKLSVFKDE